MARKSKVGALVALLGLSGLLVAAPAGAVATPPGETPFAGYATGSTLHVNALQTSATAVVADVSFGFSGASVNSQGQTGTIVNEMGLLVQPAKAERESFGTGSGLEVGLQRTVPIEGNQINSGRAMAGALPLEAPTPATSALNNYQTGLQTREVTRRTVGTAVHAAVLRGQAQAMWNDQSALAMLGNPLGFGLGYAEDIQLLNQGAAGQAGEPFPAPVVATDSSATSGERSTGQTISLSYLVNNGDGTCGLASETRGTLAPLRLNVPPDTNPGNDVTIEILGEFILRAVATGKAPGTVTFSPAAGGPNEPLVRVIQGNNITNQVTLQQLLGENGLFREVLPALSLAIAEKPRAISAVPTADPDEKKPPVTTLTEASAAVDIARLRLIPGSTTAAGLNALDLRFGHFEAKAVVPEGGINCEIPVTKSVSPNPALAGTDVTFTITIPSTAEILIPFPCQLTKIRVVDVTSVKSGNPKFTVVGGTGPSGQAGTVDGNTVTFEDIGSYKPGDPPLTVQVVVRLAEDSEQGELRDDVTVTATPDNCIAQANAVGRALGGQSLFGLSGLTGSGSAGGSGTGLTGTTALDGPSIVPVPRELPRTGGGVALPALAALALAAGLLGLRLRRAH